MKMYSHILCQYVNTLDTIPNIVDFRLYGVTSDNEVIPCHVALTPQGTHFVADQSGLPIYSKLVSWFGR